MNIKAKIIYQSLIGISVLMLISGCGNEHNVSGEEPSPALAITSSPITQTISGELYQYRLTTNISLDWGRASVELIAVPEGMSVTNEVISWTPNGSQVSLHNITLQVIDTEYGRAEQSFELNVNRANQAPIANEIVVSVVEDHSVEIQLTATDPNNDPMTFELLSNPEHGTVQQNGAYITFTPVDNFFGNDRFVYIANDGQFSSNTATVTIEITGENDTPTIISEPLLSVLENNQYLYLLEVIDVDGDPIRFSLLQSPVGMNIDTTTGKLSWLPSNEQLGEHNITIEVADPLGATVMQSYVLQVVNVNDAPVITSTPITTSNENETYLYSVIATDPDVADRLSFNLDVAPVGMVIDSDTGVVSWTPTSSQIGSHTVTLSVSDSGGLKAIQSFVLVINNVNNAPIANIDAYIVNEDEILTVNISEGVLANDTDTEGDPLTANINSLPTQGILTFDENGSFTYIPKTNFFGNDRFTYIASDGNAQSDVTTVNITVKPIPEPVPSIELNAEPLQITAGESSTLSWSVTNADSFSFNENIGSQQFVDSVVVSPIITTAYTLTATGEGGTISDSVTITVESANPLPPNPTDIAPALNPTKVVNLKDAVEFLYTGDNPIQTGVKADDISAKRVAVIRGQVLNKNNTPLSGVTISIKDQIQYGQTLSRADGWFDMAVNGGGYVTINYTKEGYLPVQRQISTPWRDFVMSEDVVMIQLDPQVTTIDLTSAQDIQVAQGSIQTDADGDRQATLFFPKGTSATMVMPDGSTQSLTTLNVRATEYSVGENGRNAMPGKLPAFSGYTYAVELSVDEAVAAGATRVDFDQEIPLYVDNFLKFPTGEVVPIGWYDHNLSAWIASKNGRIIEILSITNGLADIDIEGSGNLADQAALDELGIKEEELRQLASTFVVGKKLWRSPITHFTPWDCNWPYGPPEDAVTPSSSTSGLSPKISSENSLDPNDSDICKGCIIEMQTQTLGEEIEIVGSPFKLHYRSDRVGGSKVSASVAIPLSGETVPDSLKNIKFTVSIAGQRVIKTFPPLPNLSTSYTWNGLDSYGRKQYSSVARIKIEFIYHAAYYPADSDFERSFSRFPAKNETFDLKANESDRSTSIAETWSTQLVSASHNIINTTAGLGQWSISPHHAYDQKNMVLHKGNGDKRTATLINGKIINTVAGKGVGDFSGDGGFATDASLYFPSDVIFTDDGSYLIVDSGNNRIRKVNADGIITTVAGGGIVAARDGSGMQATQLSLSPGINSITAVGSVFYFSDTSQIFKVDANGVLTIIAGKGGTTGYIGDGGAAIEARLCRPKGMAFSADGTLYFADSCNHRIRRITPEGIIDTVVGKGTAGFSPDGILASQAMISLPLDVVLASDGSIYFSEGDRIRKISINGVLSTIAGGGNQNIDGNSQATDIQLNNYTGESIALDSVGEIYFANGNDNAVYHIDNKGIVSVYGGKPNTGYICCLDNSLAVNAYIAQPIGLAFDPDDNLYIASSIDDRIRRITNYILPNYIDEEAVVIPSRNGTQLFVFNNFGRHLQTIDSITGSLIYSFTYTNNGYLTTIIDLNSSITTIERNSDGAPISILSSEGQRTYLTIDTNDYLVSVINPNGDSEGFEYNVGGLMTQHLDPLENSNTFEYDYLGRLVKDKDALNGERSIERADDTTDISIKDSTYTISTTSAEGRVRSYKVKPIVDGREHINISTDDTVSTKRFAIDGSETSIFANNTLVELKKGPDPRFGLLSPLYKSFTITTPNNLKYVLATKKSAVLADKYNKLSHTSLTNTTTINGNARISQYITATKTWTNTSSEGRMATNVLDEKGRVIETAINSLASTNFIYNTEGRITDITQSSGVDSRETTLAYYNSGAQQGFLESITDAANRETSFSYDNAGRLLTQTLPNGNDINFNYDANGNITSITPANNEIHSFDYTKVDKTSDYTPPDVAAITQPSTQYSYNLDKQLELISLPDGQEVDHVYHATKGHKIQTKIPRGNFDYAYNATTGQIAQVTAPDGGITEFTYDGSLVLSAQLTGTVSGKVNQVYNNDFQVIQRCVNTSDCIDFSYDKDLLLTKIGELTINRAAQKGGLITGTSLGNISTSNTYNDFGEPLTISSNDSDVYSVDYSRDKLGRITQKVETLQGSTTTFDYTYDLLGQLSTVKTNDVLTSSYSFDDNGNRTHINGVAIATFDAQDRLKQYLTNNGNNQYLYSDNGDLVSKTNTVANKTSLYHYDVLGNLISAAIPDVNSATTTQIEYIIDAQNRRIGKKVNGALSQGFLYKDQLNPIAELDGNGAIVSRFVYGRKAFVPDYMVKDGKTYRILLDHLGSPRLVINTSDSTIAQRLDYDVWGNITLDTNPGFQPFGFAGGVYDHHTKFTRFGARDYDAEIGRWTTKDPIGLNGGLNVYGYVSGDPVNNIDPDGRIVVNLISAGIGAILGGYSAYQQGGSIVKGALIGGVSNLLGGKAIRALTSLLGNLASQTNNPCFSDFNWSQAAAAGLLGLTGGLGNLPTTNGVSYIGQAALVQGWHSTIAGAL